MSNGGTSLVRRGLDRFYAVCGLLAGLSLVAIAVLVMTQIIARLFGAVVSSTDEFAGFAMAAASFLALAYTFNSGGHIRVSMLLDRMPAKVQRVLECACLVIGGAIVWFFAWHSAVMSWQSYLFGEVSQGTIPVPLWIPQSVMTLGIFALGVALADNLVRLLGSHRVAYAKSAAPGIA